MGDRDPLVSIITPTYNHEKYIAQCIESVLSQTYTNWEMIIVDDGSTDGTPDIVRRYGDGRINYSRQENTGIWRLGETYNKALSISKGELVAILEGDDFWPPWKLEKQIVVFDKTETVLSWGKAITTDPNGRAVSQVPSNFEALAKAPAAEVVRRLLSHNFITSCTVVCQREALLSIGGFHQPPYVPYVDLPTWLELSKVGKLVAVDAVLGFWRRHGGQTSARMMREMIESRNRLVTDFLAGLPEERRDSLGISANIVSKIYRNNTAVMNYATGRLNLHQGKLREAREGFRSAISGGTAGIKARALAGVLCSYLGLDFEKMVVLTGRRRLSEID